MVIEGLGVREAMAVRIERPSLPAPRRRMDGRMGLRRFTGVFWRFGIRWEEWKK